ncbi:MAG: hypothetical protein M1827_003823 [Pycnora praestabilis]|nr:MAG: hypothetical protein M1827_003823 [Pycnora praestabilis]
MASAAVASSIPAPHELCEAVDFSEIPAPQGLSEKQENISSDIISKQKQNDHKPHDLYADINYYFDAAGEGKAPEPHIMSKAVISEAIVDTRKRLIHDIRGTEDEYNLENCGFQYYKQATREQNFNSDEDIITNYYPEAEEILKKVTGASKVFVYEHIMRRIFPDDGAIKEEKNIAKTAAAGPVYRLHVDHTHDSGPKRVWLHIPNEAPRLLKGRYQIINIWRPLKTILKDPLCVVDTRSVKDSELLPVKMIYPDREAATYTVLPGEEGAHKFCYLHAQQTDELLLFKNYDSKQDGRSRFVCHGAFVMPEYEDMDKRESIELRCMVFHEDDKE